MPCMHPLHGFHLKSFYWLFNHSSEHKVKRSICTFNGFAQIFFLFLDTTTDGDGIHTHVATDAPAITPAWWWS